MENRTINLAVVEEVAKALQELKEQMVFVGGAVVSIYADDPAADEVRPTGDIDMTIQLNNYGKWSQMQERLAELHFYPDPLGPTICRYKYENIAIDIMSAEDSVFGLSNKWYQFGFSELWNVHVGEVEIQLFPAPCYLATKFEAFKSRGSDYRTSHDFEDIIYVLDNRTTIVEEVANTEQEIKKFLQSEIQEVLNNRFFEEIIAVHLHPLVIDDRLPLVERKMKQIVEM